jgi:pyrroline-5-carboxylate reductase
LPNALKQPLVVSIAAGIRGADLSRWLGGYGAIVRCMPNTPALIGMGITGMVAAARRQRAAENHGRRYPESGRHHRVAGR